MEIAANDDEQDGSDEVGDTHRRLDVNWVRA
jgi:hypothetical protein